MKLLIAPLLLAAGLALAQTDDAARVGAALAQIDAHQRAQREKAATALPPVRRGEEGSSWVAPIAVSVLILGACYAAGLALRRRRR